MNEENDIAKADRIVGIRDDITTNETTRAFEERLYRRGAYIEWMTALPDFHGRDAPRASDTIELLAAYIVRKAEEAKGDGLPDESTVRVSRFGQAYAVRVCHKNDAIGFNEESAGRMHSYLTRCLSAPVRKLLSAFDVVEERPKPAGEFGRDVYAIEKPKTVELCPPVICYLMPKETK